jgi:deoxyribodipyrimidine photo-lyase
MSRAPVIVWFRQDLRLADNPALAAAAETGAPIIPVFILDETAGVRPLGGASKWWLNRSLAALEASLASHGSRLVLRRGAASVVLKTLIDEIGATAVHWNRLYDPGAVERDTLIKAQLNDAGVEALSFNAGLLNEPWTVKTGQGGPFKVFTPYWRAARARLQSLQPAPPPSRLEPPSGWPESDPLASWRLHPHTPDWSTGFSDWTPGEAGAAARLEAFLGDRLDGYAAGRDHPALDPGSRLSPHLHWGEIGPRQVWARTEAFVHAQGRGQGDADKFLTELGWREFNHHLLLHFPRIGSDSFREAFDAFPWRRDPGGLEAWRRGRTGYPLVDAGMRELWATGFMHNRVRMIVASFLVKDLLVDWREGEAWFWDTLVDADIANNAANWQWVAGSGADAAPYFRIFNPVSQGERFDGDGVYIRRWVPELARLPAAWVNRPWEAPADVLAEAGVVLGETYPRPIVDRRITRERALAAYATLKTGSAVD